MKKYRKLLKLLPILLVIAAVVAVAGWYLQRYLVPVVQPAGPIGVKERNLIIFTAVFSIAVVVPVFGLLGFFAWHYREGNKKAKYEPEQDGSRMAETIWWTIPTVMMVIISVVTWRSTYALDPYKQLVSKNQTLQVQVVSLDWKWLFLYPQLGIATVNQMAIPTDTPVDFEITSDSVMSSFWAPSLGGQMYAMPGMTTHLNLAADKPGDYNGSAANISGKGFADMKFTVKAMPHEQFASWIETVKGDNQSLSQAAYAKLADPKTPNKTAYYATYADGLYDTIMMKYMMPTHSTTLQDFTDRLTQGSTK